MKAVLKWIAMGAAVGTGMAAAPAQAQDRPVGAPTAGIAAAGTLMLAQARYYGRPGYRPDRRSRQHAVRACTWEAQRRAGRYGPVRANVRDVQWLRNGRVRVLGAYERGDRRFGRYERRAFTCEVHRNGRVTSFRTHNYRW